MWSTSTAVIRYSPKLLGTNVSGRWWAILECDAEIGRYLRHLFHLATRRCHKLRRPAWREHITMVRDEEPPDQHKGGWGRHAGRSVPFAWHADVRTNGEYYWVPVICPFAGLLRVELGLSPEPPVPYHLSIGHSGVVESSEPNAPVA